MAGTYYFFSFSSKIGHVKIKLETTKVLGYFYTACSGSSRPFCICIRCESCKWRPLRWHYGTYGKPLEYKLYFHWSISDNVCWQCRENETTAGYHGKLQQLSSIDVSVNEWKRKAHSRGKYVSVSIITEYMYAWITIRGDFLQCSDS